MPSKAALVFLAEDDDDMRALIARALRHDGHAVVEAADGAELLGLLAAAHSSPALRPDVIVTDILMPGYSGVGVLSALHAMHWDVPVIVITARAEWTLLTDALRLGAAAVFRKPLDLSELRATVSRTVSSTSRISPVEKS